MKTLRQIILGVALAIGLAVSASAQGGNAIITTAAGAPTGACSFIRLYVRSSNGALYNCWLGAWNLITGGGGGGTGLLTLNGLTADPQSFAFGATGTAPNVVSSVDTHTFHFPLASGAGVTSGTISKTSFDSFTAKESALTFSSPLSRSVNTISIPAATTSVPGHLTAADWTTFNDKQAALGFTPPPNTLTLTATSPLTGGGDLSANRSFGCQAASGAQAGCLSAANWTTFNDKAPTASPTFTGTVTIPTPFTLGAVSVLPTGTELNFVDGVTSALQTQLDAKAPLASPTFTGTVTYPTPFTLGAVSVLPTGTELNFVDGVTSAIQTQLDTKAPTASPTFTGTVTIPTPFTLGAVSVLPTGTELNFVDGVTSAIQTQLNAKLAIIEDEGTPLTFRSNVNFAGAGVTCADDTDQTTCTVGGGGGATAGAPLYVQTASATALTSGTETTIIGSGAGSLDIPGAWFTSAGTVMDVRFSGKYSTGAVPGTLQLKLKLEGTVVCQTTAFTPIAAVTDGIYAGFVRLIARTVGASGTIFCADGLFTTGTTLTGGQITFANPTLGTAVTIDTTAVLTTDLTAQWGTAATNSITGYTFELVGPGSAVSSVFGMTGAIANLSGDVVTSGSSVTTIQANAVVLTTDTTGNYVASHATGLGLIGGAAGSEGAALTTSIDYAQTLAGNPALVAGETIPSDDCPSGGFLTEGSTANTNEQLHCFVSSDGADTTSEITENTATQTLTNKTLTAPVISTITNTGTVTLFTASDTVVGKATTDTLTNKTLDATTAGNVFTAPKRMQYRAAVCQNATASLGFSTPTSSPAVAACNTFTNLQGASADFADSVNLSVQDSFVLSAWNTTDITVSGVWFSTTASTNSAVLQIQVNCLADGEVLDNTSAFDADILAITDAGKGTASFKNDFTGTLLVSSHLSTCAPGDEMTFKFFRDSAHASDTFAGIVKVRNVTFAFNATD